MDFLLLAVISNNLLLALLFLHPGVGLGQGVGFTFNGFRSAKLDLDGIAEFTPNGLLRLSNETKMMKGHAFYPDPIPFKNSTDGSSFSFSTTFVFAILPHRQFSNNAGHGVAFVAAQSKDFSWAYPMEYFGLVNTTGNTTDHLFAVELDTIQSVQFQDINDNHVGIDINGLVSDQSAPAGYYPHDGAGKFENLSLISGQAMQVWVDYDGIEKRIDVTLAPFKAVRPSTPLLSLSRDLSPIVKEDMYVGFSTATGRLLTSHYILGWSFKMNGNAQELALSKLPNLPRIGKKLTSEVLMIAVPVLFIFLVSILISGLVYTIIRKRRYAELLEDWEINYGPHRFKYKDLYIATRGFAERELLGAGGFGRVYRGILPNSKVEIAVKKVSHDSRQGIREFVAEISSIGRLRHRNLVTLLGYCRRKGELLLVYAYMPNGSLDKYLFDQPKLILTWAQRFRVIKGVASALLYLHEGWEQVVIHRDIKASNVLLDDEFNGRLGDFGLARLYDHGSDPKTTRIVGTVGYLAPEHYRTGKAVKASDVFSFGAFLLEVATGRRPVEARGTGNMILVDWVFSCWTREEILEAMDPNLGGEFVGEEVELVLKLGLICSHLEPGARPTMRQVVQYIEQDVHVQDSSPTFNALLSRLRFTRRDQWGLGQIESDPPPPIGRSNIKFPEERSLLGGDGFNDFGMAYPSSPDQALSIPCSVVDSLLSGGR